MKICKYEEIFLLVIWMVSKQNGSFSSNIFKKKHLFFEMAKVKTMTIIWKRILLIIHKQRVCSNESVMSAKLQSKYQITPFLKMLVCSHFYSWRKNCPNKMVVLLSLLVIWKRVLDSYTKYHLLGIYFNCCHLKDMKVDIFSTRWICISMFNICACNEAFR